MKASYYILVICISWLCIIIPLANITVYPNPTITSKFMVFILSCLVILTVLITLFLFIKLKPLQVSKLDIILLLLILYITLNRYAFQSTYGFSIRYIELLGLLVVYLTLRTIPSKMYLWLLLIIVISGIIQANYGILQLLGHLPSNHSGFNITGSFFNPGPYAGFLATIYPLALGLYLFKEESSNKVLLYIKSNSITVKTIICHIFKYIPLLAIVCILLVLPSTHSRGAWLAVILSSLVLLEYRYYYVNPFFFKITYKKKIVFIAVAIIISSIALYGIYDLKKESSDGRFFIWKVSSDIIKDFPLTGVGFDRFKAHYMSKQANYFAENGETTESLVADNTYYTFNDWLQFIVENGLVGFLLLCVLVFTLCKINALNENKILLTITRITLLTIGIFAFFSYPMQILPIKLIIVIVLASFANLDTNKFFLFKNKYNIKQYTVWAFNISIVAFGAFTITKGVAYIKTLDQAYKGWKNALSSYQYGDYKDAITEYKKAYPVLNKEGDFLMNYGKTLAMNKKYDEAVKILEEAKRHLNTTIIETTLGDAYKVQKQFEKAEAAYQTAYNMIPIRFYPLYLQAKLYQESGEIKKAVAIAKMILKKEIKIPSTAIHEIKNEMEIIIKNNTNY